MEKLLANKRALAIVCGVFIVSVLILLLSFNFDKESEPKPVIIEGLEEKKADAEVSSDQAEKASLPPADIFVDIKGAVKKPGVYKAAPGQRVLDLINKAGSFKDEADKDKVNLAQTVTDQMVIYVPAEGEQGVAPARTMPPETSSESAGSKVNINTATEEDLQTLTGIGPSKAAAILEYREQNGGFKNADELKNISGIGDKTFEKIKDRVLVQ
ncbi:competence protein ComEA [Peribacillus deserti]|uniref:Competence protein ComEA n=1 Tax=Peribacillus deserti TaxID=673318 RepID=A0ABS2QFA8_9BACI|nr:helix-hairpin-helix domain-containing protein [Peribacillus deserti]MBM7691833.1 competence protein ComEA [Peribacillus deserti]